jgi:hypothetical protein
MKNSRVPENDCITGRPMTDGQELEILEQLVRLLEANSEIPPSMQQSLNGLLGMKRLVAAMTIVLVDYGGTEPWATCEAIAEDFPDLYDAFGEECVLALCEEIQNSEIPEQSALFQELFRTFNDQYFAGRLPEYRIQVVYDVWYWETERYGYPASPALFEASGFIAFDQRRILIRFLSFLKVGLTMQGVLLHEMAHAATDGDHGDNWTNEMLRLKLLGAPVDKDDFEPSSAESGALPFHPNA